MNELETAPMPLSVPVTIAQVDTSAPPADTSLPPASADAPAGEGATGTLDPAAAPTGQTSAPPSSGLGGMLLPLVLVFGVLMLFTLGGGRKEKKRRAKMLGELRKGVRVQTVGGVIGTVVDVRDDEVLVKVDENSNTRIRFAKSAINAVTAED